MKSEAFKLRELRYKSVVAEFVQKSAADRWMNFCYLWMSVAGATDRCLAATVHLVALVTFVRPEYGAIRPL